MGIFIFIGDGYIANLPDQISYPLNENRQKLAEMMHVSAAVAKNIKNAVWKNNLNGCGGWSETPLHRAY